MIYLNLTGQYNFTINNNIIGNLKRRLKGVHCLLSKQELYNLVDYKSLVQRFYQTYF